MMARYREHSHDCFNKDRGCKEKVPCNGWPERDEDGNAYCEYEGEGFYCEDCYDAVSCDDCGALEHLKEAHEDGCEYSPLNRDDSVNAKFRPEVGIESKKEDVA